MSIYHSSGRLTYSIGNSGKYKLIVSADQWISDYYRAMMPKFIVTNKQLHPAHISVVRNEVPFRLEHWAKYQNKEIEFEYENVVHSGTVYYWLNVFCKQLEEIRQELGLEITSEFTRPPDGFSHCFHMTIGNSKGLNK